jgi:hypothetical protein
MFIEGRGCEPVGAGMLDRQYAGKELLGEAGLMKVADITPRGSSGPVLSEPRKLRPVAFIAAHLGSGGEIADSSLGSLGAAVPNGAVHIRSRGFPIVIDRCDREGAYAGGSEPALPPPPPTLRSASS